MLIFPQCGSIPSWVRTHCLCAWHLVFQNRLLLWGVTWLLSAAMLLHIALSRVAWNAADKFCNFGLWQLVGRWPLTKSKTSFTCVLRVHMAEYPIYITAAILTRKLLLSKNLYAASLLRLIGSYVFHGHATRTSCQYVALKIIKRKKNSM